MNCPICGSDCKRFETEKKDILEYSCEVCDKFVFTHEFYEDKDFNDIEFRKRFFHMNLLKNSNTIVACSFQPERRTDDSEHELISYDEIMKYNFGNINERIDSTLLLFYKIQPELNGAICFDPKEELVKVFFGVNQWRQAEYFIRMLKSLGLVEDGEPILSAQNLCLTYRGWNRIDELLETQSKHNQGFIAMMFDEALFEVEQAIKNAISKAGYKASIIKDKQYNGQIVPEILYEIRQSDFVIADMTGNRGGVYYEAGYGLGVGKELIITVNENLEDEQPHFDIAQINQIRYSSPEELEQRLYDRIIATVGKGNQYI